MHSQLLPEQQEDMGSKKAHQAWTHQGQAKAAADPHSNHQPETGRGTQARVTRLQSFGSKSCSLGWLWKGQQSGHNLHRIRLAENRRFQWTLLPSDICSR